MQYSFTAKDYDLAKAFSKKYDITVKGLGGFGEKTGEVESFNVDDCHFPASDWNYFGIEDPDTIERLNEEPFWYADDLKQEFNIDVKEHGDLSEIVVFSENIGQINQNFIEWWRAVGDMYCDMDDLVEFIEDNPEYNTKEISVARVRMLMKELGVTLQDLKSED